MNYNNFNFQNQLTGKYQQMEKESSIQRKKLHVVAVSDTHGCFNQLKKVAELTGDIFIHAGDFTDYGREQDFKAFFKYLQNLKFRYKIVISGNHQIMLDNGCIKPQRKQQYLNKYKCSMKKEQIVAELKKRCIYLEHEMIEIEGVKIFGSPYSPYFVGNAFQYMPQHQKAIWGAIPENIDLLITHCPPINILDQNSQSKHAGSEFLREVVFNRKPKYHIFGHIHESSGMQKIESIIFLNVANQATRIFI